MIRNDQGPIAYLVDVGNEVYFVVLFNLLTALVRVFKQFWLIPVSIVSIPLSYFQFLCANVSCANVSSEMHICLNMV